MIFSFRELVKKFPLKIDNKGTFMKYTLILILLISLLSIGTAFSSGSLIATWNPNQESDLAGYKVYYGTTSGDHTNWTVQDVGDTRVINTPGGKMEFKLKMCKTCGKYWAPEKQLDYIVEKWHLEPEIFDSCPDCRD